MASPWGRDTFLLLAAHHSCTSSYFCRSLDMGFIITYNQNYKGKIVKFCYGNTENIFCAQLLFSKVRYLKNNERRNRRMDNMQNSACISSRDISKYRNAVMGLAALSIFIMHCIGRGYIQIYKPIDALLMKIGSSGVDIFLFLSGFGIFCSLNKNHAFVEEKKYPCKWLFNRIMKVYIPYFLIMLVFVWFIPHQSVLQLFAKMVTLDFWMHGNDGTWFVSFIILLYILSPMFYKTICTSDFNHAKKTIILEMILLYAGLFLFEHFFPKYSAVVWIAVFQIPQFIFGLWLGYMFIYNKRIHIIYLIAGIVFAMLDLLLQPPSNSCLSSMLETGFSFVVLWCYIVMLKIVDRFHVRFLKNKYFVLFWSSFCSITLEFYLIHLLTLDFLKRQAIPVIVNLSAIILLVFTYFTSLLVKKGSNSILRKIHI